MSKLNKSAAFVNYIAVFHRLRFFDTHEVLSSSSLKIHSVSAINCMKPKVIALRPFKKTL